MAFGDADLRAFCRQMGRPVTFGAVSTYPDGQPVLGLLDQAQKIGLMESGIGGVEDFSPELRLPSNAFSPMPATGDSITVDGKNYVVNQPTAVDDGGFVCYQLLESSR